MPTYDEIRKTSSTGGQKGQKAARFDLLPPEALFLIAEVFGYGAEKYAAHNWRKGYEWSLNYAAMNRHLWAFWQGEDNDPESGLPHLAHAGFHVMALLTFMQTHPEFNDRPNASVVEKVSEKEQLGFWRKLVKLMSGSWFK